MIQYAASDECGWGNLERQRELSVQQYRIAQMASVGMTNTECGRAMGLSEGT